MTPPVAAPLQVACSNCKLRELCLPTRLNDHDMVRLDGLVQVRRAVRRGDTLFRCGEPFNALFAVRTGFFKTRVFSEDGRDQVTGFQMAGELLGLEAIGAGVHSCDAVALEDSQVCVIPYERLEVLAREFPELQRQFHRILSREIVRHHGVMLALGSMRAEERVAAFLLNLTQRLEARGFSASALVLRMTREEIGSLLGLTLETVSRTFSKLQDDGVLSVRQRRVQVLDAPGLRGMLDGRHCAG